MGVVVIYGNEPWIMRRQKEAFKNKAEDLEFGYEEFTSPNDAANFLLTCNFFVERLYAYLRVDSVKEISGNDFLAFMSKIRDDNSKNLLIEVAKVKAKADAKHVDALKKVALEVREFAKVTGMSVLKQNLDFICREQAANFTEGAKLKLLERLDYLHNEDVNLITVENYVGQLRYISSVVEEVDIINNVPDMVEGKRFLLASFIASGQVQRVLEEAGKLRLEQDFSAIALMGLLHREYRIAYLKNLGFSCEEQKVRGSRLSEFSLERLVSGLNIISERIKDVKTGVYDQYAAFDLCLMQLLSCKE